MKKLKIVVWNMAHWSHKNTAAEAWDYLYNELQADIVLATEMGNPDGVCPFPFVKWQQIGMDPHYYWGSGIASRYPLSYCYTPPSVGAVMTAKLELDGHAPLTLISMYGLVDKATKIHASNLHRFLSDLTPLLAGKSYGHNIIIGGDWNMDLQLKVGGNTKRANDIFFDRVRDFDLHDCLEKFAKYPVQTWRQNAGDKIWQLDHLYASPNLVKSVKNAMVMDNEKIREFSDHNPIIAEFEI
jgi:exodeoxyribonuclease-3